MCEEAAPPSPDQAEPAIVPHTTSFTHGTKTECGSDGTIDDNDQTKPLSPYFRLGDFPLELIRQVLEHLVPLVPEMGTPRPADGRAVHKSDPWFDFLECRKTLRNLCLTAPSFAQLAQPFLYRTVAILSAESLVQLFRTLLSGPHLGQHARYLSCHLTLTCPEVIHQTRIATLRLLHLRPPIREPYWPDFLVQDPMMLVIEAQQTYSQAFGRNGSAPSTFLSNIMALMPRLETLLLQVPVCNTQEEYGSLFEKLTKAVVCFDGIKDGFDSEGDPYPPEIVPFQHITAVRLQGDPEMLLELYCDECGVQIRRFWPLFYCFPALSEIEVTFDDGNFVNPHPDDDWPACMSSDWHKAPPSERHLIKTPKHYLGSGIRRICLRSSNASPKGLHHLLRNAPNLEVLKMSPRDRDFAAPYFDNDSLLSLDQDQELDQQTHPECLDLALARRCTASSMRMLQVRWENLIFCDYLLGPDGRLESLRNLTSLETLGLQICSLYAPGSVGLIEQGIVDLKNKKDTRVLIEPLSAVLPPNVVDLTLDDWWWDDWEHYNEHEYVWQTARVAPFSCDEGAYKRVRWYSDHDNYRRGICGLLGELANDIGTKTSNGAGTTGTCLAKLRRVVFTCPIPWTWTWTWNVQGPLVNGYGNAVPTYLDFHFKDIIKAFRAKGVEFHVTLVGR